MINKTARKRNATLRASITTRLEKVRAKLSPLKLEEQMLTEQLAALERFDIATGDPLVNQEAADSLPLSDGFRDSEPVAA